MSKLMKWSLPVLAFAVVVALASVRADAEEGAAGAKGKVTGVIHMADGTPAANVTVRLVKPPGAKKPGKGDGGADKPAPQAAQDDAKRADGEKDGGKPGKKPRPEPVATATTDAEGKFELEAPAGKYMVMANMPKQGRAQKTVTIKAGETADAGTLTLKVPVKKEAAPAT